MKDSHSTFNFNSHCHINADIFVFNTIICLHVHDDVCAKGTSHTFEGTFDSAMMIHTKCFLVIEFSLPQSVRVFQGVACRVKRPSSEYEVVSSIPTRARSFFSQFQFQFLHNTNSPDYNWTRIQISLIQRFSFPFLFYQSLSHNCHTFVVDTITYITIIINWLSLYTSNIPSIPTASSFYQYYIKLFSHYCFITIHHLLLNNVRMFNFNLIDFFVAVQSLLFKLHFSTSGNEPVYNRKSLQ